VIPSACAHPKIDEVLGRASGIAGVKRGGCVRDGTSDTVGVVWWRRFGVKQREQRRLIQGQDANAMGLYYGSDECHCGTIGMRDYGKRITGAGQDRFK
jgi:hypothetical protein